MTQTLPMLRQTHPVATEVPWEPTESRLRNLYAHPEGWVRLGMIQSSDGKASGPDGLSRSLNGPEDLRILLTLRALADVVVVGAQTVREEGYGDIALPAGLSTCRGAQSPAPMLAVITGSGKLPKGLTPERTWIITTATSPAATELDQTWAPRVILAGVEHVEPALVISQLRMRGMTRLLCEGGPTVARRFFAADAVDDFCLTSSHLEGGTYSPVTPPVPQGFERHHRLEGGGFVMERWARAEVRL